MTAYLVENSGWKEIAVGIGNCFPEHTTVIESDGAKIIQFFVHPNPAWPTSAIPPCCVEIKTDFLNRYLNADTSLKALADAHVSDTVAACLREFASRGPDYELRGTHLIIQFRQLYEIL
jgi:hypothetical protein